MANDFRELARRLGDHAEAVCAHYLSNGRRHGRYWLVGDVHNTPGRSLYVRLVPAYGGPAGKWADAANPDHHGDLLDLIRWNQNISCPRELRREALRFLSEPIPVRAQQPAPHNSSLAASRLFHASVPIIGTRGEAFLRARGITASLDLAALRYHPSCYYKGHPDAPLRTMPAIICAVTDLDNNITGALRIYLDSDTNGKARVDNPRLSMGNVLGNGVRFGRSGDVMAAGEGIETVLSVRSGLPRMPMIAALSAAHLAAILFPPGLRRLYVVRDRDPAGDRARERLIASAAAEGIEAIGLTPRGGDLTPSRAKLKVMPPKRSSITTRERRPPHCLPWPAMRGIRLRSCT